MDAQSLTDLARHQAWADAQHWKTIHENAALMADVDIRKRINHMTMASLMLAALARGETPDPAGWKERESMEELESLMGKANEGLATTIASADLNKMISLPRGPKGPFPAPAGVLLLQALMHGQHHRGQNSLRMRELGVTPPMTDFVVWYAVGKP